MFVNANAIVPMLKILAIFIVMAVCLTFAHGIWLARLARAQDLPTRSQAGRVAIVCLAALTPIVSYYLVGAARRIASARRGRPASLFPVVPLVLFAASDIAVVIAAVPLNDFQPMDGDLWLFVSSRLIWIGLWVLVIYMIVRVFSGATFLRSVALTLALMALTVGIIVMPFP